MSRKIKVLRAIAVLAIIAMTLAVRSPDGYAGTVHHPAAGSSAAATATPSNVNFDDIDSFAQHELNEMNIPGAAVGIVKGTEVLHVKTFGEASDDGRVVTETTPFKIGSNSKSFTALAVMQLVDAGTVHLDDPVQKYLPWFQVADKAASSKITVRQLLNQTSGLSTVSGLTYMYQVDESGSALEDVVRAAKDVDLSSQPGTTYQYSNLNYTVLGLIVQTVSGQSYEDYVQAHIFRPLQMTHSYAFPSEARAAGLATGHQFWYDRRQPGGGLLDNRATTPAGLLSSSLEDMTHYLIANLNGGRYKSVELVSPTSMEQLHTGAAKISEHSSYAMGWISGQLDGIPILGHNGETGDFHSTMVLQPQQKWGVVVLMNGANDLDPAMDRVADGIMAKLLNVPGPKPVPNLANTALLLVQVLVILIILQVLAIVRSIILLRRWTNGSTTRNYQVKWVVTRVTVAGIVSLLWGAVALLVLPSMLGMPTSILWHVDTGIPILVTGIIALIWGAVLKPLLGIAAVRRMRNRRDARGQFPAHADGAGQVAPPANLQV
jgi:CubicO group peptidase (beta-lactamase class C family)